jgi:hypothetical protein
MISIRKKISKKNSKYLRFPEVTFISNAKTNGMYNDIPRMILNEMKSKIYLGVDSG